jgi:hypothetical protein
MSGETQSKQLLHLVLGGELARIGDVEFKDLEKVDRRRLSECQDAAAWRARAPNGRHRANARYF